MSSSNQPTRPTNRPGLPQLSYRIGDHAAFLKRMLQQLPTALSPADAPERGGPLSQLTTRAVDDPAIALLDAWATVADVLTFYQERIANEGYLLTAQERRSVLELARMLGYELSPGVAASTLLTFTVDDSLEAVGVVLVPKGTQVMSVPEGDQKPQTFETSVDLLARADWNALQPLSTRPQTIVDGTTEIYVQGETPPVQAGDTLLLVDDDEKRDRRYLLIIDQVQEVPESTNTRLVLQQPLTLDAPLRYPRLFVFRQLAALFGSNAPRWDTMPDQIKRSAVEEFLESREDDSGDGTDEILIEGGVYYSTDNGNAWKVLGTDLPTEDIFCLAYLESSAGKFLLAGTAGRGISRLQFKENQDLDTQAWEQFNTGLTNLNIQTFFVDERGHIFAGTPGGGVFRSKDNGINWTPIHTGSVRVESRGENNWQSINTALPNTVVRSLITYTTPLISLGGAGLLEEGNTQVGISDDIDIELANMLAVGDIITFDDQTRTIVRISGDSIFLDTAFDPRPDSPELSIGGTYIFAGTDDGIYRSQDQGKNWISRNLSNLIFYALAVYIKVTQESGTGRIKSTDNTVEQASEGDEDKTAFEDELKVGDIIIADGQARFVTQIESNQKLTINAPFDNDLESETFAIADAFIFAGTDNGIYRSSNAGKSWEENSNEENSNGELSQDVTVRSLAVLDDAGSTRYIIAGTDQDVYFSDNGGDNWTNISNNAGANWTDVVVYSVHTYATTDDTGSETFHVFAGTNKGIFTFTSTNNGTNWTISESRLSSLEVTALAAQEETLFAGSRFAGFNETAIQDINAAALPSTPSENIAANLEPKSRKGEWPNFRISDSKQIDLDTLYPQIKVDSWIVLINDRQGTLQSPFAARRVERLLVKQRRDFTLDAKITSVVPDRPVEPANFNLRTTTVLIQSEEIILAPDPLTVLARQHEIFLDPIQGKTIALERYVAGLEPGKQLVVSGKPIRTQIQNVGGVFESPNNGQQWQRYYNQGLTSTTVQALAISEYQITSSQSTFRYIFAGTRDGVFRTSDSEVDWLAINQGLTTLNVTALVTTSIVDDSEVIPETPSDEDIITLTQAQIQKSLSPVIIKTNVPFVHKLRVGDLVRIGDQLRRIQKIISNTRFEVEPLPEQPNIEEIQITLNYLFAGTTNGVFYSTDSGDSWAAINQGLVYQHIRVLAVLDLPGGQRDLLAGTVDGGVARLPSNSTTWVITGLTNTTVQALVVKRGESDRNQQTIFAGTPGKGIYRSTNGGDSWQQLTDTKPGRGTISSEGTTVKFTEAAFTQELRVGNTITAAGQTRTITATLPELTVNEAFRPDLRPGTSFIASTGLTNLNITALASYVKDNVHHLFAGTAGSGIFCSNNEGENWEQVNGAPGDLQDLEIRCLTIDTSTGKIFAGTQSGGIFYSDTLGQRWAALNQGLTNTDIRAIALHPDNSERIFVGGIGILYTQPGFPNVEVQRGDELQLLKPPTPLAVEPQNQSQIWYLRDRNHIEGSLKTLEPTDLQFLPVLEEDEALSELTELALPPQEQQDPVLTLANPLQYSYDPTTVSIYANVVKATHGETVDEVLGSGDGTQVHQRFELNKPPLTYISAVTPSGRESTLQIRVNDVLWSEARSLYNLDAKDQKYIVRIADDGTPTVMFGDGDHGVRLPTGRENIRAIYRSGIGMDGNLDSDRLTLLKTRPVGITDVTNPLPATGAAAPESREQAREKAPASVRTLDRIVSLSDFEDFARAFAGIGKAQAIALWNGETQLVHVTIAASGGEVVKPESALYTNLVQAIDAVRDPIQEVQVDSYLPLLFNVEARVLIDNRYLPDKVEAEIRKVLQEEFAFVKRSFGQNVTAAEVIAAIQRVTGVIALDLDALYRLGTSKGVNQVLEAAIARWNRQNNQIEPAQLLRLNPNGLMLKLEMVASNEEGRR